jgi:hypothetical protein
MWLVGLAGMIGRIKNYVVVVRRLPEGFSLSVLEEVGRPLCDHSEPVS